MRTLILDSKISTYVRNMDMKYLCYLILVRKDLSTSLCIRYSKSGSGTLFVPMSELFSPEGILTMTQVPSATLSLKKFSLRSM